MDEEGVAGVEGRWRMNSMPRQATSTRDALDGDVDGLMPPRMKHLFRVGVALHLAAATVLAAPQSRDPLDPRTDVSASGRFALHVEPSTPAGRGKASYRLERDGAEVWSGERPWTLWESVVADDGTVAGYAYGHGLDGWSGVRGDRDRGDFRIVILDPAGAVRADVATERTLGNFPYQHPQPEAAGLLLDPGNDRVVVRIEDEDLNRQNEEWWPFRLSTGEALPRFHPKERLEDSEPARSVIRTRPVMQTPLVLTHWWTHRFDSQRGWTAGARFALVGLDGTPAWELDLPLDYSLSGDGEREERLHEAIRTRGALLDGAGPGRFEIGLVVEAQRVSFEATPDPAAKTGWKVVEVARAAWSWEPPPAEPEAEDQPPLEQLATLELGSAAAAAPSLGRIGHFDLDDRGRFGFVREDEDHKRAFVLVSPEGVVLAEIPIDSKLAAGMRHIDAEWLAQDRWLAYVAWPAGGSNENPAWWLDVASRSLEPVAGFRFPDIQSIDGDGQGGFVALGNTQGSQLDQTIAAVDAQGRVRWTLGTYSEDPQIPHMFEAIAVAPDGRVGILDNSRELILVHAPDGGRAGTIDLAASWGNKPNYPSDLTSDTDGGWIVRDFNGPAPIVRMSAAGDVVARLVPAYADGRKLEQGSRVLPAPDGGTWVTDQQAFLHLDKEGKVDRILGSAPDAARLDAVAGAAVDCLGRILLSDERTRAVHVFDAQGHRLFTCRPAPGDEQGCVELAGAPDGRVFAAGDALRNGAKGFICYSPQGDRTGTIDIPVPSPNFPYASQCWIFQPQGGRRWVIARPALTLVDADGNVVRAIDKRPDGTWLWHPGKAGMAPDGSLALIAGRLCLYGPEGEPLQTIPLPEDARYACVAFDGRRIALASGEAIYLGDREGGRWKRHPFPKPVDGFAAIWFSQDGERLEGVPFGEPRLVAFRLPE
jgi:hypothetical protein